MTAPRADMFHHSAHDAAYGLPRIKPAVLARLSDLSRPHESNMRNRPMKKHGQDAQTIGERHREAGMRVAAFLKEREGQHATKKLARATGACTRTVTEWLGGTFPASKHLHGLIDHYGAIFIEKAFGYVPGTGIHEARDNLRRALEALERDGT